MNENIYTKSYKSKNEIRCSSDVMKPCQEGTRQRLYGQDHCETCPDGTYDPRNSTDDQSLRCEHCPEGFYCAEGLLRICRKALNI